MQKKIFIAVIALALMIGSFFGGVYYQKSQGPGNMKGGPAMNGTRPTDMPRGNSTAMPASQPSSN